MKSAKFEKWVPTATFEELWHCRLPDFHASNEIRNLKRKGITAESARHNNKLLRVWAEANTDKEIKYLEKRGFVRK
jgi:hypothetical protein